MTEYTSPTTDRQEYYNRYSYQQELLDNTNLIYNFKSFNPIELNAIRAYTNPENTDKYGNASLFRFDILDLEFCSSPERLAEASEINVVDAVHEFELRKSFIEYTKQRRFFHARFVEAISTGQNSAGSFEDIGINRILVPTQYGEAPPPEFMYNFSSWAATSMLCVLADPYEKFSARSKRKAIEYFAQIVDMEEFYSDRTSEAVFALSATQSQKERILTLPESFAARSNNVDPVNWRNNQEYLRYFPNGDIDNQGVNLLLNERPQDLIRILLMQTIDTNSPRQKLYEFTQTARLDEAIKQNVFSETASFNYNFNQQPTTFYEEDPYEHPTYGNFNTTSGWHESYDDYAEKQRLREQLIESDALNAQLKEEVETLKEQLDQDPDYVDPNLKILIQNYDLNPRQARIIEQPGNPDIFVLFRSMGGASTRY